jgi:hypothetical protein
MNLSFQIEGTKKIVEIELQNGRTAIIHSSSATFVSENFNHENKLYSISYDGKLEFKLNDELEFNLGTVKSKFIVKEILKNDIPNRYYLTCGSSTNTSYFLLPLVTNEKLQDKYWFGIESFVINSYLTEDLKEVVLIVRYFPGQYFDEFEKKIKQHKNYLKSTNPDFYTIAYHLYIGDGKNEDDIKLFIEGKYSQLNEISKKKILNFNKKNKGGDLWNILYKTPKRKKLIEESLGVYLDDNIDLYSKPNLDKEIYERAYR